MNRSTRTPIDSGVFAAIHQAGRVWRCVAGRLNQGRLTLIDHREFPAAGGQESRIRTWADQHQVTRAVIVLPSSSVICRTCYLPNASPQELEPALRLQAEAHLLGQTPEHRQAMAVLPAAAGETTRCGIVLAWPESAETPTLDLGESETRSVTYAPDIAALAALLNGQRTTEPILAVDRRDGSIALAMTHAGGATFRATREDAANSTAWLNNVGRVVAETALNVNHTGPFVDSLAQSIKQQLSTVERDQAALLVPDELIDALNSRIEGPKREKKFWTEYGLAAGTLLAMTNQLATLAQMLHTPPIEAPSAMSRVVNTLSDRRRATMIVAACVLAIVLAPLTIAGLRLAVLNWKLPDDFAQRKAVETADDRIEMYRSLGEQAWPMTKLLADLANCVPTSVEVELIDMQQGQEIRLGGRARRDSETGKTAADHVLLMEQKLRGTKIFDGFRTSVSDGDSLGNYQFDMSFRVTHPYRNVPYAEDDDYAVASLAYRQWGHLDYYKEENFFPDSTGSTIRPASTPPRERPSPSEDSGTNSSPAPANDVEASGDAAGEETSSSSSRRIPPRIPGGPRIGGEAGTIGEDPFIGVADSQRVPDPKTPEEIKAMNLDTAKAYSSELATAVRRASIDKETRERLLEDFRLVREHLRELNK